MVERQIQIPSFENYCVSKRLEPLLEKYQDWCGKDKLSDTEIQTLRNNIWSPNENLWFFACLKAFQEDNAEWLKKYVNHSKDSRPFPLNTLRISDEGKKKTYAAVCLSNCALAALYLKDYSPSEDNQTKFITHFQNAINCWQRTNNLDSSESIQSPILNNLKSFNTTEDYLNAITKAYTDKNENFEILPVKDLIYYFLTSEDVWHRKNAAIVKFPVVLVDDCKIAQLEIDRRDGGKGNFYRDSITSSFSITDDVFQKSLRTAFEYTASQYRNINNFDFRWRVRNWSKRDGHSEIPIYENTIKENSVGLAASIALDDSINGGNLGTDYVFTGAIDKDNGAVEPVNLDKKISAAHKERLPIFVPRFKKDEKENEEQLKTLIVRNGYEVTFVSSVNETTRIITERKQEIEKIQAKSRRQRHWAYLGVGTLAVMVLIGFAVAGVYAWAYSVAEYEKQVLNNETIQLNDLNTDLTKANGELEIAKAGLTKTNEELKVAGDKLKLAGDKLKLANDELDKSNKKLKGTNDELNVKNTQLDEKNVELGVKNTQLDIARNEEAIQRRIAAASKQTAYASQLAAEGYKRLAEGDKASAQTFFAKALSLDEQEEYRTGLLNASFDSGNNSYKLSWTKETADNAEYSCCATSLNLTGDLLAVPYNNGSSIKILRTQDGSEVSNFSFEKRVVDAALSAKGEYLAVKDDEGQISVLETATQNKFFDFNALPDESLQGLIFSNDNKYLAAISGSHSVIVFDVQSKKIVKNINHEGKFPESEIYYLTFSPDNLIAYAFKRGTIFINSVADDSVNKEIRSNTTYFGLGFTEKGELIASEGDDIEIYPNIRKKFNQQGVPDSEIIHQKVRPDYLIAANSAIPYFVSVGDNGIIHFRVGDEQIQQISFPMGKPVKLMLGENGKVLFQNSKGKIYCWEPSISNYKKYEFNDDAVYAAGVTRYIDPDVDDSIVVKDIKSENVVFSLKINQPDNKLVSANISKDGKTLVATQDGKLIETYDVESGKKLFQYLLKDSKIDQILYLILSNDGDKIAAVGKSSIAIISVPDSKVLATINFPLPFSKNFILESLNFSPQDNFFVAQSENSINLFDASTGEIKHSIPFATEKCSSGMDICSWVAISPDEKFVGLSSFEDGVVQLWSIENYRYLADVVRTGVESPERAVGAAFTTDSRFLMWSSAGSGRLHFYDVKENKKLPDFPTGEGIEALFLTRYNELFLNGYKNFYITDESNIISLLKGDAKTIKSQVFNKTGFMIDSSYTPEFSQDQLNSILKNVRPNFELLAVDQDGLNVKSEKDFGGVEVMKVKKNADGTSTQCPTAFVNPIFNPYPLTFKSPADFCAHYPVIDVRKTQGESYSLSEQSWLSTRLFKTGDDFYVLMYMSNGAANNLSGEIANAKNVKIKVKIDLVGNDEYILSATFLGDNLAPLTGTVKVKIPQGNHLVYSNNVEIYDYQAKAPPLKVIDVSNAKIQDVKNLSFEIPVGDLKPGFATDLFIRFPVSVKQD